MTAPVVSVSKIMAWCLPLLMMFLDQQQCHAWISSGQAARFAATQSRTTALFSSDVDSLSLVNVSNHEEEGEKMAKSIASWLDAEVRSVSVGWYCMNITIP